MTGSIGRVVEKGVFPLAIGRLGETALYESYGGALCELMGSEAMEIWIEVEVVEEVRGHDGWMNAMKSRVV